MKKIYLSVCFVLLTLPSLFAQCNTIAQVTTNISCFGRCDGAATAFAFGGAGPYTYTWSPGNFTGASISGLCPGIYTVTSIDSKGCKSTSMPVTVTEPAKLSLSFSHTNVTCNAGSDGSSTVTASGGTPGYTYSWNTNPTQTAAKATALKAGIYTVNVLDVNFCKVSGTDTIKQPAPIVITSTVTNATCGKSDGKAAATANSGVAPYTYSWNTAPVQTTATATTLAAGVYVVTATDANGCTQTATVTVNNVNGPTASVSSTDVSCFGGTNGTASAVAKGGTLPYTFSWNSNPVQTTATASGLPAKTYTVTVTDNLGCISQALAVINQPSALSAATSGQNISCKGGNNGTVAASASGGTAPYSYSWNTVPVQTKDTVTALKAGTYTVTISDANGCTLQKTVTLTEPGTAITTSSTIVNVTCNGGNTGSARETISGGTPGYTYAWNTNPPQFGNRIIAMKAGIYTLTVTDAGACKFIKTDTIKEPAALVITASSTNSNCGKTNGTAAAKVSGGTPGYAYSWNTNPAQTTATATALAAGVYTVTVTDTLGCVKTAVDTVKNLNAPVLSVSSSNVSCLGARNGTATVTITGGTAPISISWSTVPIQTTATATGLAAGTYTVTVTDNASCSTQATVTITAPKAITISNTTKNVSCNGGKDGSILVTISGGTYPYTQLWKPSKDTSLSLKNIGAGTDTIIVTDANGCQNLKAITVSQPAPITASTIQTNVSCNGGSNGSATVSGTSGGTGPYTYSWNTNPIQTGTTATGLSAASYYTLTVKDFNACLFNSIVIITQPAAIALSTTVTNSNCGQSNGQIAVTATGGTAPFTYSWNTNPVQTTATATALAVGIYKATVTDNKGCIKAISDTVKNLNAPAVTLNATNSSCFGAKNGTAAVKATGGAAPYSYSWNTNPVSTSAAIASLAPGTYTATVTDNAGCASVATAVITEPSALAISVKQNNVTCNKLNNGSATATVTGGTTPYTYLWSGTGGTAASATNLTAGNDTIKITDGNGCLASKIITITEPTALTGAVIHTNVSCNGGSNGSATVSASGGTTPYSYSWNTAPVQTGTTAIGLTAGTYTVTITDGNGCILKSSVTITEPLALQLATSNVSSNCSQSTGQAAVTVSGGSSPYSYSWNSNPVQTTSTATALPAGVYTVTVTDNKSCKAAASATVNNLNAAVITTTSTNVSCFGGANGTATASATGGTAPLSYSWNTKVVQTTPSVSGLSAGTFTVTVKDNAGCISNATVAITQPAALGTTMSASNATCSGCKDGTASVKVAGGTSPYTYLWTPGGNTSASLTGLGAGKYKVCITDNNSCGTCDSVVVSQPVVTGLNADGASASMNVYPNPNNGTFLITLETASKQSFSIKVTNTIGQVVAEQKVEVFGNIQIPMELNNAEGVYFIKIQSDKEVFTKRIFVNK